MQTTLPHRASQGTPRGQAVGRQGVDGGDPTKDRQARFEAAIKALRAIASNEPSRNALIRWTASIYGRPVTRVRELAGPGLLSQEVAAILSRRARFREILRHPGELAPGNREELADLYLHETSPTYRHLGMWIDWKIRVVGVGPADEFRKSFLQFIRERARARLVEAAPAHDQWSLTADRLAAILEKANG